MTMPHLSPRSLSPRHAGDLLDETVQMLHSSGLMLSEAEQQFRKRWIERVLRECHGNQVNAARELGMHRNTLGRAVAELKIRVWNFKPCGYRRPDSPTTRMRKSDAGRKSHWLDGATSSAAQGRPGVNLNIGFTNSVRNGGRGESPELPRGGDDRSSGTELGKPPRGENLPDIDVECGGLKA